MPNDLIAKTPRRRQLGITRRSITLCDDVVTALDEIKAGTGAKTDTAAVNDAVRFLKRFGNRSPTEIGLALNLWDQLKHEITVGGRSLYTEQEGVPASRTRILVLTPGGTT